MFIKPFFWCRSLRRRRRRRRRGLLKLPKTTAATATGTLLNKRFNEQNNGFARAYQFLVHFFAVLSRIAT